ncbi:P1 family peptidase [soil metagenome]
MSERARDLGIVIGSMEPGPVNAITDVTGVRVGHTTLIEGDSVRTGVTIVVPHDGHPGTDPVFAGCHRINGNGDMTGLEWVRELGMLTSPIGITNTLSVGVVRDAIANSGFSEHLPVVGETYDGGLNDMEGQHVRAEHALAALAAARGAPTGHPVDEGNVGGGTGMICHELKGGIGTSSRVVDEASGGYTVGVLVQANHGRRERFRVNGAPVGERLGADVVPLPEDLEEPPGSGSIIILVTTDAPLLPHQCNRLALRAGFGVARTGGVGEHSSGDLVLAFATGNRGLVAGEAALKGARELPIRMLSDAYVNPLYDAVIDATEEAIVNAVLAAETMVGYSGKVYGLNAELLREAL